MYIEIENIFKNYKSLILVLFFKKSIKNYYNQNSHCISREIKEYKNILILSKFFYKI